MTFTLGVIIINYVLPQKVYKYMAPKYLKMLEENEGIFINHLNNYPEKVHGSEIGDDFEGHSTSVVNIDNHSVMPGSDNSKDRQVLRNHGFAIDGTSSVTLKNVTLQNEHIDNNYFVYCVSLERKESLQKSFGSGLQTLHNFPEFIKHVTGRLNRQGIHFYDAGECHYIPKREQKFSARDLTDESKEFLLKRPYFIKEEKYSHQREYRVIWRYDDDRKIDGPILLDNFREAAFHYHTQILKPIKSKKNKKKNKKK